MSQHQPTDHELLVRLDERVEQLLKWSETHEKAHTRVKNRFITAIGAALLALFTVILDLIFRN